ncbi:MAG: hypothetical protein RI990_52, partial [Planctomycetota bacterium]
RHARADGDGRRLRVHQSMRASRWRVADRVRGVDDGSRGRWTACGGSSRQRGAHAPRGAGRRCRGVAARRRGPRGGANPHAAAAFGPCQPGGAGDAAGRVCGGGVARWWGRGFDPRRRRADPGRDGAPIRASSWVAESRRRVKIISGTSRFSPCGREWKAVILDAPQRPSWIDGAKAPPAWTLGSSTERGEPGGGRRVPSSHVPVGDPTCT